MGQPQPVEAGAAPVRRIVVARFPTVRQVALSLVQADEVRPVARAGFRSKPLAAERTPRPRAVVQPRDRVAPPPEVAVRVP